jgi:beta-mannanase
MLRGEGVSNVTFVWQASASPVDDVIEGRSENIQDRYPGNNYVDWLGLSWFLPPVELANPVKSQRQLANKVLNFSREKKLVMIAESAPQGYNLEILTRANSGILWNGKSGSDKIEKDADVIW